MSQLNVAKVTLSTQKVVYLREMKIKDQEMAAQVVAPRCQGDSLLMQMMMPKELVKFLVVQIDDRKVTPRELEDIDSVFSLAEYSQILQVVGELAGGKSSAPRIETVAFGDK